MTIENTATDSIQNLVTSRDEVNNWTLDKAIGEGLVAVKFREEVDLREEWWEIGNQYDTHSCVAWAATDGLLRYHMVKAKRIKEKDQLSVWHTWMAASDTDKDDDTNPENIYSHVNLRAVLHVLLNYGAVHRKELQWDPAEFKVKFNSKSFVKKTAKLKIKGYYQVINDDKCNADHLRMWISSQGPVLALVVQDAKWERTNKEHEFNVYEPTGKKAVCHGVAIVGYTKDYFIVRNSWGTEFSDKGFVKCSDEYIEKAICEAYGIVL